jgi:lysine 2,3-aminomutase
MARDGRPNDLRSVEDLQRRGLVDPATARELEMVREHFDIRVPAQFLEECEAGDSTLSRQFVPSADELKIHPTELEDPIGDEAFTPIEGITHRYPDRVLFKINYTCAVYCRFCFRRYKVAKPQYNLLQEQVKAGLDYISQQPQIWEVILTGGDPLVLSNERLRPILDHLQSVPHVKVLRFHTRIPSVAPERINDGLLEMLKNSKKSVWMAVHINSPSELKDNCRAAIRRLIENGIGVVSQSVLLRGVNDDLQTLEALMRGFVELGIKPYALNYPDLAKGTQHFRIPLANAIELVAQLRGRVSGLCLPQLIVDIPGGLGKISVDIQRARQLSVQEWEFKSPLTGEPLRVVYPPTTEA